MFKGLKVWWNLRKLGNEVNCEERYTSAEALGKLGDPRSAIPLIFAIKRSASFWKKVIFSENLVKIPLAPMSPVILKIKETSSS